MAAAVGPAAVIPECHGGNVASVAQRLGCQPADVLDASASLVPFAPSVRMAAALMAAAFGSARRVYPDRGYTGFCGAAARLHGLPTGAVLAGNGASELLTWAARDAAAAGQSVVFQPGFADYGRALRCWGGAVVSQPLELEWSAGFPQPLPAPAPGAVLWITNPHNPTGRLWSCASLEPMLERYRLVICDEAFLPLVPGGEAQSLIPWLSRYPNLIVIRSLTKLYGVAGLRLGYALASPERLKRWASWRDPWPVNGLAASLGEGVLANPQRYGRWCGRAQAWVAVEGAWLAGQLARLPGLVPMPSAANYLLIRSSQSLQPLREALEQRHRILLRDCRSFPELGANWLRLGYQSHRNNRRLLAALAEEGGRLGLA